jgi:hypothetical protein
VPHDPVLALAGAPAVTAGVAGSAIAGGASITDPDGDLIVSATITLGAGRQAGDRISIAGHPIGEDGAIGDTGPRLAGGGFDPVSGTLVLTGAATPATYAAVIAALELTAAAGGVLEAGERGVTIRLVDAAGDTTTESLTVSVLSSVILGDGTAGLLTGTDAAATFVGSGADETMRGGAGNDLFLIGDAGGADIVEGGAGFDTIMLGHAAGPPVEGTLPPGGWTVALDGDVAMTVTENALEFAEPASGRITFGDGQAIEFSQIERVSWCRARWLTGQACCRSVAAHVSGSANGAGHARHPASRPDHAEVRHRPARAAERGPDPAARRGALHR